MSDWPPNLTGAPIREWPGTLRTPAERRVSAFSAPLRDTLRQLDREIYHLVETSAQQESGELLVAIPAAKFRRDGRPYADARAEHPGIIFSLDTPMGRLSYPCDTFTTWQDNLRAVALALEALRKVDRYGVTKRGEQYRGFLAIEATTVPAGFARWEDALKHIITVAGWNPQEAVGGGSAADYAASRRTAIRDAKRKTHPDTGGDADAFQRVSLAEAKLREAGLL